MLTEFRQLWADVDEIWQANAEAPAFDGYVSADYEAVYKSLLSLRGRAETFLEWGSGLGVVTIMASRMGFEAYGIEAEASLVEYAEELADTYGEESQFAHGSFIPDEFEFNAADGDEADRTAIKIPAAYGDLDMELRDFDLVFVFPWPDEHQLCRNIMRQCGREDSLLISYDACEGVELITGGVE